MGKEESNSGNTLSKENCLKLLEESPDGNVRLTYWRLRTVLAYTSTVHRRSCGMLLLLTAFLLMSLLAYYYSLGTQLTLYTTGSPPPSLTGWLQGRGWERDHWSMFLFVLSINLFYSQPLSCSWLARDVPAQWKGSFGQTVRACNNSVTVLVTALFPHHHWLSYYSSCYTFNSTCTSFFPTCHYVHIMAQ